MKIISIVIDNTKIVRLFHIKLDGKNLHVAGDVSQGKTTAISALWDIIEKKGDSITHGEKQGCVRIVLEGGGKRIIAERLTVPSGSTLRITDQDGGKITAQDFKGMLSALAVNPHKIMDMKGAEQVKTLLAAAAVDIDLEAADKDIVNLEANRLGAFQKMEALKPGPEPEKAESVDVSALIREREDAGKTNRDNQANRDKLVELKADREELDTEVDGINDNIKQLKAALEGKGDEGKKLDERIKNGAEVCKKLKDIDAAPIDKKIETSSVTNNNAVAYTNWTARSKEHATAQEAHKKLDDAIKDKRTARARALETAKWPLKGLAVEDGKVLYKGNLLSNLGESEQMLVCCALAIKDIKAHALKVVRIDGAESMSPEHIKSMVKMFNDEDIQVLSTRVSRGEIEPEEITIVEGVYDDKKAAK